MLAWLGRRLDGPHKQSVPVWAAAGGWALCWAGADCRGVKASARARGQADSGAVGADA